MGSTVAGTEGGALELLLVEDDELTATAMVRWFESVGTQVTLATSCTEALAAYQRSRPDAVVSDYRLEDGDALSLLSSLRELDPTVALYVVTGHASIELAVRAVKAGARDFFTKPVELALVHAVVRDASSARRETLAQGANAPRSAAMRTFLQDLQAVAATDSPVLLLGETGTGKTTFARRLHDGGPRAARRFVDINCGGLRGDFFESEIFGHERGAFTGAVAAKPGLIEVADGGTLFLDEIGDIDLAVQAKILKVLEEKRYRRLGDVRERTVDVRLVAATHRDLRAAAELGSFRADLFYRVSTLCLTVPPLRDRAEDLPSLARAVLDDLSARRALGRVELAADAVDAIQSHDWPGNLRELRNVLERAIVLRTGDRLTARDLRLQTVPPPAVATALKSGTTPRIGRLEDLERHAIEEALREADGKVPAAATRLGIPRSTLYQKLKVAQIDPATFRTRRA